MGRIKRRTKDNLFYYSFSDRKKVITVLLPLRLKYRDKIHGDRHYWEKYTAAEPHHGAGFTIVNDQTGSFRFLTATATYAYHLGLNAYH